jgi:branched-chain amino acid transport system ATP-binding protein
MLEVEGLRAGYGRIPILGGVSLHATEGSFVGILGHNGTGKTTLLKVLMGLLPATAGTVRFAGKDITHASTSARARAGLGYVPQGRDIFPALSVRDNLRMGCVLAKEGERRAMEAALALFPRLAPLLDRPGGALSGGEQQLLAIARCLCGSPKLILLDEPTEGIQPSIVGDMIDTLRTLRESHQLTVLLVEQDLQFIAALADRVLIIQKGVITREASPSDVADPALVAEFVGMAGETVRPQRGVGA